MNNSVYERLTVKRFQGSRRRLGGILLPPMHHFGVYHTLKLIVYTIKNANIFNNTGTSCNSSK